MALRATSGWTRSLGAVVLALALSTALVAGYDAAVAETRRAIHATLSGERGPEARGEPADRPGRLEGLLARLAGWLVDRVAPGAPSRGR
jgi:hypothetical protein